jgi:hypothetical protein
LTGTEARARRVAVRFATTGKKQKNSAQKPRARETGEQEETQSESETCREV